MRSQSSSELRLLSTTHPRTANGDAAGHGAGGHGLANGDLAAKKSPKSQLSGLHRELGAILKEIKVITDKIRDEDESSSIEVSNTCSLELATNFHEVPGPGEDPSYYALSVSIGVPISRLLIYLKLPVSIVS